MQAIVETLFDAVYLISVITIGILMIRGSKGNRQFRLFGFMAVVLGGRRCVPPCSACAGSLHHRSGKLYGSVGDWKVDYFRYHDGFLCTALLCMASALSDQREKRDHCRCIHSGRFESDSLYDAAESVAECRSASFLGNLPQYSFCSSGTAGNCFILSKRKRA